MGFVTSRLRRFAAGVVLTSLWCAAPAHAGTIGFTIQTTVDTAGGLSIRIDARNTGDEAANDVRPIAEWGDVSAKADSVRSVAPGQTQTWTLHLSKTPPPAGIHAAIVRLSYEDANGYPFEVLASAPFSAQAAPRPVVQGQLTLPPIAQNASAKGALLLTVPKERGDRFTVRLVTPAGVSTSQQPKTLPVNKDRKLRIPLEVRNVTLLPGTSVNVFALVTGEGETPPQTDLVQGVVRIVAPPTRLGEHTFTTAAVALLLLLLALEVISGFTPRREFASIDESVWARTVELALILAPSAFLLYSYPWDVLLAKTITAGGDMASLYYPTKLMAEEILPSGQITGWTMGNYAGFPVLHFYSTLPFVLIALLGKIFPMTIVFKLVTLAGPTLLPIAAAFLFRCLGYGRGAPALAAASTLPFLMQQGNSMWGGNIPSVLAGEFCHSIGITLSLVMLGVLYRVVQRPGTWAPAALLLAMIGLCHTFAFMAAAWYLLFFLLPSKNVARTAPPVIAAGIVAGLILCIWGLPLPGRLVFTSEWSMIWRIKDWKEVLPEPLWPATGIAAAGLLLTGLRLRRWHPERQGALLFMFGGGVLLYFLVPALGFPDIRFVPISQLFVGLLAADFVWWLTKAGRHRLLACAVVVLALVAWGQEHLGYIPSWLKWNYSGYEGKTTWAQFKEINDSVRGDLNDPRVVFEHSQAHNRFGSSRAFENLPLFSGRSTLEGVFHQASQSSPFIFYLQSEASERGSGPFPQYTYTRLNLEKALPHLRLFNVGHVIVVSDKARQAYEQDPGFRKTFSSGQYAVFEVKDGNTGYVVPLENEPVLYDGPEWKLAFMRWFKHHELNDIPLVPADMIDESERREFTLRTDAIERLPRRPLVHDCQVTSTLEQYRIHMKTTCPGRPHMVKVSYFPRWHTTDGSRLLPVSPGFMLVYPKSDTLVLEYRRNLIDWLGVALTLTGIVLLVVLWVKRAWAAAVENAIRVLLAPVLAVWTRYRAILIPVLLLMAVAGATYIRVSLRAPEREYEEAQEAYKARDFRKAADLFGDWTSTDRDTFKQATALYQLGISQTELKNPAAAIVAHEKLRFQFPNVDYTAGTWFHLARNYAALGSKEEAKQYAEKLEKDYADSSWVRRLRSEVPDIFTAAQPH